MADYETPMNNLRQSGFKPSSLQPEVSGESKNAPYGPKACKFDDIESLHKWGETQHEHGGVK